ncbi:hypothetical protein O6H91_07G004100 [Diphasiastrum complanatum]|uniref:Uncharacterized protein n=1 Tax=Diphasiastrum complanatum TaxID=34168 RepID=A0ACC2D1X8_DIPCM|nr:hypothetical protein O6H91_07G004100 [Diphasiastrum complanatum]
MELILATTLNPFSTETRCTATKLKICRSRPTAAATSCWQGLNAFSSSKTGLWVLSGRWIAAPGCVIKCSVFSSESSSFSTSQSASLREIPGSYGLPVFGPLKDRLDFFWFQGENQFYKARMDKYESTVFRVNFPPFPPGFPYSRGVALLDQKSYGVLYDTSKVQKEDMFTGSFAPSKDFTGGYRMLAALDPSHEKHTILKSMLFELLKVNRTRTIFEFSKAFAETFDAVERQISQGKQVDFYSSTQKFVLDFLIRTIVHRDPAKPGHASLANDGPSLFQTWIGVQYGGIAQSGLPHIVEEFALHNFPLPFFLVKGMYGRIYKFFRTYATEAIAVASSKFGLDREEATHNLIFILGVNAWLGLIRLFPAIIYHVANGGSELQGRLRAEVRSSASSTRAGLTAEAIASMPLIRSTVLEVLRLSAPAKYQYARAKTDLIIESHDAAYMIKKGELLGGCLHFASRDPAVFDDPETFVADRFMGEKGKKLLPNLLWSNGYNHQPATAVNKQCGGKDLVEHISCLFLAELFTRYDSFQIAEPASIYSYPPRIKFTSMQKKGRFIA